MSDSDRPEKPTWPTVERRAGGRGAAARPGGCTVPGTHARRRAARGRAPVAGPSGATRSAWEAAAARRVSPRRRLTAGGRAHCRGHRRARVRAGALLTLQGRRGARNRRRTRVSGCNIENATYGLTLCAERVALVKALSDGHGVFTRIAVVADTDDLTPPCGPCRQLLWEYCGDIEIVLANLDGRDGALPPVGAAAAALRCPPARVTLPRLSSSRASHGGTKFTEAARSKSLCTATPSVLTGASDHRGSRADRRSAPCGRNSRDRHEHPVL